MPVVKKRNQQTESRLLLESDDPVELPPAEVEDGAVVLQFEQFRQYVPELLEELRDGTTAEPVPVMMDGSTFVVHGDTRSFWVKLWHSSPERTRIDRVQVISCLPSTRGVQILVDDPEDDFDDDEDYDDDDFPDDDEDDFEEDDEEDDAAEEGRGLPR
ncbi:MAG TPA: hypothetical protein VGX48_10235 [Pyrinomonadaceae bacterium]|jgi:hypothetical protein|nr:hypothetical protein [Pyrinomonadaceae bacterium]